MKNKIFKLVFIFAILEILFEFVYVIFFIINLPSYFFSSIISIIVMCIPYVFEICTGVLLIVGLKKEKPMLIVSYFALTAIVGFWSIIAGVGTYIYIGNEMQYLDSAIFNDLILAIPLSLSSIVWHIALGLLGLQLVKTITKREDTTDNLPEACIENRDQSEMLLKYKELLDIGAITQEEFNKKKKELLE